MNKTLLITAAAAVAAAPVAHSQIVVAAPGVEARQDHKNIFDALKYAWEQAQWADKLATLHNTLTTVREQLETANLVKQEEVAADEISRERNRELARLAAEAEAELPDFNESNSDLPPGF